jgi:hypothetical protein
MVVLMMLISRATRDYFRKSKQQKRYQNRRCGLVVPHDRPNHPMTTSILDLLLKGTFQDISSALPTLVERCSEMLDVGEELAKIPDDILLILSNASPDWCEEVRNFFIDEQIN